MVTSHRIRLQRWLVRTSSQEEAFATRLQLHSQLETALLPAFERAFDALGLDDEVVHVPHLALDLKLRPDEDFIEALTRQLRDRLQDILQKALSSTPGQADVQRHPMSIDRRRTLLHYLATGRIEWHAQTGDTESFMRMLRAEAQAFAGEVGAFLDGVGSPLVQRAAAGFRLLQLLPEETRQTLLAQAPLRSGASLPARFPEPEDALALLPAILHQLIASDRLGCYLLLRIQALLLALRKEDLRHPPEPGTITLLRECLDQGGFHSAPAAPLRAALLALTKPVPGASISKRLPDIHSGEPSRNFHPAHSPAPPAKEQGQLVSTDTHPDAMPEPLFDEMHNKAVAWPSGKSLHADTTGKVAEIPPGQPRKPPAPAVLQQADDSISIPDAPSANRPLPENSLLQDQVATQNAPLKRDFYKPPELTEQNGSEGFMALDAGLVLLHPFLERLFAAGGIAPMSARKIDEHVLPRAASLLHWLLSGREEVFEFELTTIKVLLGLSPEQELPVASGLLSGDDRTEADHLLASAISHWTALGKTSVAGLRMSFLQRRGLLRDTGQGWQLQVEPESFDMLLGSLPWGIGIVRLPWMTKPIFTEWPTA